MSYYTVQAVYRDDVLTDVSLHPVSSPRRIYRAGNVYWNLTEHPVDRNTALAIAEAYKQTGEGFKELASDMTRPVPKTGRIGVKREKKRVGLTRRKIGNDVWVISTYRAIFADEQPAVS